MKNILFFLLFCCCAKLSSAQSVFPAEGAQWYHQGSAGEIFHSYVANDTVIQGYHCKKIVQDGLLKGSMYYDNRPMFVFTAYDTTFIFNPGFNRFTPLYIFNAQEGDSICLPLFRPGVCASWGQIYGGDSTFCFVVDSIRMVRYDTALLKTFYTQSYQGTSGKVAVWAGWSQFMSYPRGAYVERVGGVMGNIYPYCRSGCTFLAVGGCQAPDSLRCYQDGQYSIKMVSTDCDNGMMMGISEQDVLQGEKLRVFPNPATDYVFIENQTDQKLSQITFYSPDGKLLRSQAPPNTNRLSTEGLADGIYYLHLRLADHTTRTKKIIIQKNES